MNFTEPLVSWGDRRGLNPRQLEPQSSTSHKVSNTCDILKGAKERIKQRVFDRVRTGYGLRAWLFDTFIILRAALYVRSWK